MALSVRSFSAVVLCLSASAAIAQQSKSSAAPVPIVQPGAPGKPTKTLPPSAASSTRKTAKPDVDFMQGMIMHHQQAVDMVAILLKNGKNERLRAFGIKISLSQTGEIKFMKQWLTDRGEAIEMSHGAMMAMPGAKMDADGGMSGMMMPGMLTPAQMDALSKAKGDECDHLFLTGMIQHHGGALSMVDDLLHEPLGAQDPVMFDFATDIDNTQSAEIKLMQSMLEEMK
jgi:uncharacterized protein (DUF305 family)